jgi:hypothetical protein
MDTFDIIQVGALIYPIMLTQEVGEISEAKASELLGLKIENYREIKSAAVHSIMGMIQSLPSPIVLLLGLEAKEKAKN